MRGSQECARRDGQRLRRRRRVGGERGCRPSGDGAQPGAHEECADASEERERAHGARPAAQRGPPDRRRGAHDAPRAHPRPHLARREPINAPQREGQGDGSRRVESTPQDAARHYEQHGTTGEAVVPPARNLADLGRRRRRVRWAPLVPGPQAVAVNDEPAPGGTARGPTARAARRSHLARRGEPRPPGLDVELRVDDSSTALAFSHRWVGARRGACANTPPSPASGRRRASTPPPGRPG